MEGGHNSVSPFPESKGETSQQSPDLAAATAGRAKEKTLGLGCFFFFFVSDEKDKTIRFWIWPRSSQGWVFKSSTGPNPLRRSPDVDEEGYFHHFKRNLGRNLPVACRFGRKGLN